MSIPRPPRSARFWEVIGGRRPDVVDDPVAEFEAHERARQVARWKEQFESSPFIWACVNKHGDITNLYDSEEGAQLEILAHNGGTVAKIHIHTTELARERWVPMITRRRLLGPHFANEAVDGKIKAVLSKMRK